MADVITKLLQIGVDSNTVTGKYLHLCYCGNTVCIVNRRMHDLCKRAAKIICCENNIA